MASPVLSLSTATDMPSLALSKFENRVLEVKRLLSLCTPEEADYRIKKESASRDEAILRGAHVLLCSHVEGYFEDLIADLIHAYDKLAKQVDTLPEELRAHQVMGPGAKWDMKEPSKRWQTVQAWATHPLVHANVAKAAGCLEASLHTDGFSNPGTTEIEWLFRTVGISEVWAVFKGIEPDQIYSKTVDAIVNRRNQIAHGKADATVTLADAVTYVQRAERVAEVFNSVVTTALNNQLKIADCWAELEAATQNGAA